MSSQMSSKPNVDGVHCDVKVVERPMREIRPYDLLLRFLGLSLTLVATIIVGVDNETKVISYAEMQFKATAKWEYVSAIVCIIGYHIDGRSSGRKNNDVTLLGLTALDLVMMALLFSANGAACAVGVIAQKGNSHVQWMKVCNVFDAYCRHVTAALVLSLFGSTVFLLLVLLSVLKLHYRTRS
ncbi:CASP-like protein 1E1 [Glycine soja]|uniref:CASP-like protein n=1 Tax=Glycine soja TaxID=3848 RepID=A0A445FJE8_GLYSO|nr:CASP-like protein [Glycine soja]RZB48947.1 CASP-like protein 1E1 [Glycine soja]